MGLLSRSLSLTAVSLTALIAAQGGAQAGAFAVREQSATAQGYSFAGAASGSGYLSSMFWNPAVITMAPGWQSEWHASLIIPRVDINPLPSVPTFALGGSGDIGQDAIVPAGYSSYQINDMFWVGLSSSSPYGLVTDPRQNWSGQVYSRSSRIFSLNFNPVVGVKVNDWFSFAVGPSLQYFDITLKRAVPFPGAPRASAVLPGAPSAILDGDDIGFGFTAGVTITPFAGTTIGVGYRSQVEHELEGNLSAPFGSIGPFARVPITAKLKTPDQLTIGFSQVITPAITVHAGFEWTNWSVLKTPPVVGPGGVVVTDIPLNYDDGFFYSLGADYRLNDQWILRAGVAYEESPIDTEIRSTRLPDNDRIWTSIGASYQWNDRLSFDVAYTHIFAKETEIRIVPGQQDFPSAGLPFEADVDSDVDIVSAAVRYRWDDPKVAIPAPIVRKY
ncbi:TonB-dependent receptor [Microvirga sp. 3-52]|uniref:OmpP1/FadL family transporter n=1 Tax=Microvirga sp. 3-52 TaxID=2792425 RepID=UPI001AC0C3BE|nr:outer membrane protein transport protein [Microvirga sp. 3-52]MBO1904908.1 TonB-dependent receptor [Microvirga sp. 3-52]MBS7452302.1 TonB-dependent receptor [Microvirga sp. 3-52]